jgi:homoserine kinase
MVTNWLAELDGRRVTVEVPASSANLGAGYDCLGVALGLTNRVEVEVRGWSRGEIDLTVEGEGAGELAADRTNRCVLGIEAALKEVRGELPDGVGWRIEMHNEIPLARGLGSSAARNPEAPTAPCSPSSRTSAVGLIGSNGSLPRRRTNSSLRHISKNAATPGNDFIETSSFNPSNSYSSPSLE